MEVASLDILHRECLAAYLLANRISWLATEFVDAGAMGGLA